MSSQIVAVAIGALISLGNFLTTLFLFSKALERKTTTAAAITVASFIARLTFLLFLFVCLVNNPAWGSYIYSIMAGFIVSHLLLTILEIKMLIRLEARLVSKKGAA